MTCMFVCVLTLEAIFVFHVVFPKNKVYVLKPASAIGYRQNATKLHNMSQTGRMGEGGKYYTPGVPWNIVVYKPVLVFTSKKIFPI